MDRLIDATLRLAKSHAELSKDVLDLYKSTKEIAQNQADIVRTLNQQISKEEKEKQMKTKIKELYIDTEGAFYEIMGEKYYHARLIAIDENDDKWEFYRGNAGHGWHKLTKKKGEE